MPRERAYSDPLSPPLRPTRRLPHYDPPSQSHPTSSLTAGSLARLSHVVRPSRRPTAATDSPTWPPTSPTPSSTSVSEEEEDEAEIEISLTEDKVQAWIKKGKYKAADAPKGVDKDSPRGCDIQSLPPEILVQVSTPILMTLRALGLTRSCAPCRSSDTSVVPRTFKTLFLCLVCGPYASTA